MFKAFHLIPLDEESSAKTAILTPWGTFKFRRLAMGLRNSAQSFQKLAEHVLSGIPGVYVYIDDVLIHNPTIAEHLKTVEAVCQCLSSNDLTISLNKCVFGVSEIDFLGYRVDSAGIVPLPKRVQAIVQFP